MSEEKRKNDKLPGKASKRVIVQQVAGQLRVDYAELLESLKKRIRETRVKAGLSVNRELVRPYWLAMDLRREFPDIRGFSRTNLKYTQIFAQAYPKFGQQPVDQRYRSSYRPSWSERM